VIALFNFGGLTETIDVDSPSRDTLTGDSFAAGAVSLDPYGVRWLATE
jgi:hypothetical protein